MTSGKPIEPPNIDDSIALDGALKELIALRSELKMRQAEIKGLKDKLNDALTELARWKVEAIERRQLMIKAQTAQTVRVPITGVVS